jgi:hypothetical protein
MAIGFVAAVVSGGLTLVPTAVGGAAAGAGVGALAHKRLRLAEPELNELGNKLSEGRTALLVMRGDADAQATAEYLVEAGGTVQTFAVSDEDLRTGAEAASTHE